MSVIATSGFWCADDIQSIDLSCQMNNVSLLVCQPLDHMLMHHLTITF